MVQSFDEKGKKANHDSVAGNGNSDTSKRKSDCYKLNDGNVLKKRRKQAVIRYVRYNQKNDPENYFRETLMLFHCWRQEREIIGRSKSYEQAFLEVLKKI